MRLSTFPLVSNPLDTSFRHFLKNPWSLFGSDAAAKNAPPVGRRFQRPTSHAVLQHVILSLIIGFAVAYAAVLPLICRNGNDFERSATLLSCILTVLGTLVSVLDGDSHEVNVKLYLYPSSSNWYAQLCSKIAQHVAYIAVAASPLSILLAVLMTTSSEAPSRHVGWLYAKLSIATILMAMYVFIMDEAIRTALFHPRPNIHQMVEELYDDTTPVTRLGVILHSLLCDQSLVKEVWSPSQKPGMAGPEREEMILSEKLTKHMASVFLCRIDPQTEAPLEEDVLRIAILESLGGRLHPSDTSGVSERHQKSVNEWIDRQILRGQLLHEPLSTPLVRGLYVFLGGAGESLAICATSSDVDTWKIPPAAFVCMEFAVQATARCIVRSLTPSGRTLCDWKSSHLSIQVPASLQALFQLRRGIVQYSKFVNRETNGRALASNEIGAHIPAQYGEIVRACDMAASSIMHSLKCLKGLGRIDLSLSRECLDWTNTLLARRSE